MTTLNEMWARFQQHQSFADARGYGEAWAKMCSERTEEATDAVVELAKTSNAMYAADAAEFASEVLGEKKWAAFYVSYDKELAEDDDWGADDESLISEAIEYINRAESN